MYYLHCADIAAMVAASSAVKWVYYPEREYANAPQNPNQIVKVFGHHIPKTFKNAADIVNGILNGTYDSTNLPTIGPGPTDNDSGS
jgi:hypothetical protein